MFHEESRMCRCPAAIAASFILALAALLTPAGALAASASPSPGSAVVTYKIGINQDYDGMNPFSSWSSISWESFRLGYDFLTWYDKGYRPTPDVASSWETSSDGKTWTFHIRAGMTWQDGRPLTARDVAFTYNLIIKAQDASYIQYLTGVTRVTATDDQTLVIQTDAPNAGMLALYIPILPEHIWKKADPNDLGGFKNSPFVGSGPFRVTELKKSKWVKLEANKRYPQELGGAPTLDEVYFVISQNTDSMIEDYRAGNVDAVVDFPATYEKVLGSIPGTTAVASPAIGFHELAFNCWNSPKSKGNPLLRDAAIREAVHWAIDKTSINATSMAGLAVPGTSVISPVQGIWHWDVPQVEQYRYDPEKARQILTDAGYADRDGDGVRENARGRKLEFRLVSLNEYPEDQAAAKMIVSWCADIGIKLRLDTKDEGAFGDEVYDNANYDMFVWSWGGDIDPGFMLSTFTTKQILNWGDSQYSNPAYDKLYVRQAEAVDPAHPTDPTKRKVITDEMQRILYRDNPYIVLWYNVNLQAFRTDTWSGYRQIPAAGGAPFWNYLRTTYIELKPEKTVAAKKSGTTTLAYVVVGLVAAVVIVGFIWFRRRPRAVESV
jgi:peptide/nickel transport system substrate-binding protein